MTFNGYKSRQFLLWIIFPVYLFTVPFMVKAGKYEDYINKFALLAIQQQEEFGIPASITLAQGLLESGAGTSKLATAGNNHFGIKCHKEWKGESMNIDDDSPDECFRVYHTPEESFRDHSLFLKRPRYSRLFTFEITDYKSWATTLKECGYATDPKYAARLITIIERYSLYSYDIAAGRVLEETTGFIRDAIASTHPIRKSRGLHYVIATPGDSYKSIAKEFGIKEKKLLSYNDAGKKDKLIAWEEIYLEEKHDEGPEEIESVTIGEEENFRSIAQKYGIKLSSLKKLNKKTKDRPGTELRLHK